MGFGDWCKKAPIVSQVWSFGQACSGDMKGAAETQEIFSKRCPVVSQLRSLTEAAMGDDLAARRTQEEYWDQNIGRIYDGKIKREVCEMIDKMNIQPNSSSEVPLAELAQMARDVYDLDKGNEITSTPPEGWRIDRLFRFYSYVHVKRAIYKNDAKKLAVLAFKGTGDNADLYSDLREIVFRKAPFQEVMANYAQEVKQLQDDGFKVLVTGHSLGGYVAELVASHMRQPGCGFCAPGTGKSARDWPNKSECGFVYVNFWNDNIGNVFKTLHAQGGAWVRRTDTSNCHAIREMCDRMKQQPELTNQNLLQHCKEECDSNSWYQIVQPSRCKGELRTGQLLAILADQKSSRLDIGKAKNGNQHESWATRLCFQRLDGPSTGPVCFEHVVKIVGTNGKRLDIGPAFAHVNHESWATRLRIVRKDLKEGPIHYGEEVGIFGENNERLDIGPACAEANHESWATRFYIVPK